MAIGCTYARRHMHRCHCSTTCSFCAQSLLVVLSIGIFQMKSVGEVMAIGRTWQESLQKALRGMEAGLDGWSLPKGYKRLPKDQLMYKLRVPNPDRMIIMKQVCSCRA
jgi:hypothetical protein